MKISELLTENIHKKSKKPSSNLPSAASIDDEPLDDLEDDDIEDDVENNDDSISQEELFDTLREDGGSMGSDLYSITVFNTKDDFADPYVSSADAVNSLEDLKDNPIAQEYVNQGGGDVGEYKIISCLILNSRNNQLFRFDSGQNVNKFTPSIAEMIADEIIDSDQAQRLELVRQAGNMYHIVTRHVDWRAGEEPSRRAESIYNRLDVLKDSLNLKEPRNISYGSLPPRSPEIEALAKKSAAETREAFKLWKAQREKEKQIAKNPAGRKKR
jgi:hypothetical protein